LRNCAPPPCCAPAASGAIAQIAYCICKLTEAVTGPDRFEIRFVRTVGTGIDDERDTIALDGAAERERLRDDSRGAYSGLIRSAFRQHSIANSDGIRSAFR
jgi:hypothetical protein